LVLTLFFCEFLLLFCKVLLGFNGFLVFCCGLRLALPNRTQLLSQFVSIALRLMPYGLRLLKVVELQEPRRCALMTSGRRFLKEEPQVIEA
jgi:hypothetical protein